jgi:uncharacterized protein YciI
MVTMIVWVLVAPSAYAQSAYDATLAQKLKADEFGMKTYVMAFLKAGPNRDRSPEEAQALQRAHLANINRLAAEGKLVVAGPFADEGPVRGIYIFDVATVAEAEALTRTDPAIQVGSLTMELHPWYASAALMMVNDVHARIEKRKP